MVHVLSFVMLINVRRTLQLTERKKSMCKYLFIPIFGTENFASLRSLQSETE